MNEVDQVQETPDKITNQIGDAILSTIRDLDYFSWGLTSFFRSSAEPPRRMFRVPKTAT